MSTFNHNDGKALSIGSAKIYYEELSNADILIIRGDKDHLIKRKFVFDAAELIENSYLSTVPFAGHAVHIDQTEITALTINKFLEN